MITLENTEALKIFFEISFLVKKYIMFLKDIIVKETLRIIWDVGKKKMIYNLSLLLNSYLHIILFHLKIKIK